MDKAQMDYEFKHFYEQQVLEPNLQFDNEPSQMEHPKARPLREFLNNDFVLIGGRCCRVAYKDHAQVWLRYRLKNHINGNSCEATLILPGGYICEPFDFRMKPL